MSRNMEIKYPELLPDLLHQSADNFEKEAKMAMVVKLFEMQRISSGMAAEIVEITRVEFLKELEKYGVSMINIDPEELASDVENA